MELSQAKRALLEKWLQGQKSGDTASIPRRSTDSPMPLSFPQQRQLFLEMLERGTAVNNLSVFLELKGNLDLAALEQSANQILARHEVLRTRFSFGHGMPVPEPVADLKFSLEIVDLQVVGNAERMQAAQRQAEQDVLLPFDLTRAPLIRLKLFVLNKEHCMLLVVVHHTIADGWSLGVFLRELMTMYQALTNIKPSELPELPIQYGDYAAWQTDPQRIRTLEPSLDYWKKQLAGELPELDLPTDRPRGAKQSFSGGTLRFTLPQELTDRLENLCKQENATLFMALLTGFYVLLHRYSGQEEILVGTPVANRNLPELEPLIGVFINTLVLRANLSGEPGFRTLLRRVRDVSLEAYAHQDLPFEQLVEALKPKRDLSRTPLFQVVFNLQNAPRPNLEIPGLDMGLLEINRGVSQFDLTLMMTKSEGRYHGTVEYNDELFNPASMEGMFGSFQRLLEHAVAQPECPVSQLQLLDAETLNHLVYGRNQTQLDVPRNAAVHQLFEKQVEQTPDAVALVFNDTSATYLVLNQRANTLARRLQALGVGPGIRVGILMERSPELVAALLAVLKAGGTYVPMHTAFPKERVRFILKEAEVKVLLTNLNPEPFDDFQVPALYVDEATPAVDTSNLAIGINPDDLAYIIFTSGSTGQPKGVMVQHAALVNFLWSMHNRPGMSEKDVLMAVTSVSFDIAALELFLPLVVGGTVVVASEAMITNPIQLGQAISRYGVNVMQATPATWQLLLDAGWTGAPELIALCGGEALSRKLADRLLERVGCLWNMYGPTETTIWSAAGQIQKGDTPITIGQPIGNTQLYVLDRHLQPVPPGVVGELHIGGAGVAMGYLNQVSLTEQKFIPDVFSAEPGARLYKTGDYARYLPDHTIEVLGRMDDQVKLHGHRIELGEIETVLMQHPAVRQAVATVRTEASGDKRLLAYYVPEECQSVDAGALQDFLRQSLPAYMMPSAFIPMEGLPLSVSGKTDRKALPLPESIRQLPGFVAPRTKTEQILASIWQDVLEVEQVGIHDNFFDLGGASIQSIQLVAKANMSGLRISVENLFEFQTIAELAAHLKESL